MLVLMYMYIQDLLHFSQLFNIQATTMLSALQRGVSDFGIPLKIWSDDGGENIDVGGTIVITAPHLQ